MERLEASSSIGPGLGPEVARDVVSRRQAISLVASLMIFKDANPASITAATVRRIASSGLNTPWMRFQKDSRQIQTVSIVFGKLLTINMSFGSVRVGSVLEMVGAHHGPCGKNFMCETLPSLQ